MSKSRRRNSKVQYQLDRADITKELLAYENALLKSVPDSTFLNEGKLVRAFIKAIYSASPLSESASHYSHKKEQILTKGAIKRLTRLGISPDFTNGGITLEALIVTLPLFIKIIRHSAEQYGRKLTEAAFEEDLQELEIYRELFGDLPDQRNFNHTRYRRD